MSKKTPTSFVLDEPIKKIKDELAPVYGLKNILSGGLLLFHCLSPEKREEVIAMVKKIPSVTTDEKLRSVADEDRIRRKIIQILRAAQSIGTKKKSSRRAKSAKVG